MDAVSLVRNAARINVVGTTGSGKSTVSRRLAALLRMPHLEMDRMFWQPGWRQTPEPKFLAAVTDAVSAERWVLDGNYGKTIPVKWARADVVLWLDYGFVATFTQLLKRTLQRAWTGHELWPDTGNRESFRQSFLSRHSILWWMITTYADNRRSMLSRMNDPAFAHIRFIRLTSRAESEALLSQLQLQLQTSPTQTSSAPRPQGD